MKLDARRTPAFLRDPGPARVALLHGDDEGLVRARADALTLALLGAPDDPFRVAWLSREDHARLEDESSAIAMLGGRRTIRVRDATDALTPAITRILSSPGDTLVILECPALPRRSKLLAAVEAAHNAAAIACYPEEGPVLRAAIAARLDASGVRIDAHALDWLRDHLGGDHASTRNEVDKLILYAGDTKRLDLDEVRTLIGDGAAASLDDALYATTAGDLATADRTLERTLAEGQAVIGLLRALLSHFTRMHQVRGRMDTGTSAADAVDQLRPPVFWKRKSDLVGAMQSWPLPRITAAMAEIRRTELACKQTGAPDDVMVRRLILALARSGRR